MKKISFLIAALILGVVNSQLFSGDNMLIGKAKDVSHGSLVYGNEMVNRVQSNGFVTLNGTQVTEHLQVNGRLKAEEAEIEAMQVNGQATLDRCSIFQKSSVCGSLIATLSKFSDELSVSSEKVFFDSCTLNTLQIIKVNGYQGVQIVELRGKTKINGSIVFESGNGEIIADPECEITGNIVGGKVRK